MVKLQEPTMTIVNGNLWPAMHIHSLKVLKSAPNFPEGETVKCYIASYVGGRFAVWDSTWHPTNKYHVFQSEQELHEHFEEL